ncbi:MAG: efflux RND transporter periplasmic adaptor subunit [gamma proteobacterium endosymbiont of Lamellibrachia anaximandri]|nr:efflux RND transporter periplasmic adaptor subunit [gamma proteobacterium endosymbiont of Lamellibrachia anaximandri]
MKMLLPGTLLALIFLTACGGHQHNGEHNLVGDAINYFRDVLMADDHGHDHASQDSHDDHGGGDTGIAVTHFTQATELFVEFPALVMGQESPFAAHLTRLDNFQPIANGVVTLTLSGGGVTDEVFSVNTASVPGIFRPVALPKYPVTRQVSLRLQGEELDVVHYLGKYTVHPSQFVALAELEPEEESGDAISYLKEQQWQVDFALTQAVVSEPRASIQATGTLRPRADGEVYLSASSAGHLRAKGGFPFPGMQVEPGQVLATIAPRLGAGGDLSTLKAARDKARSEHQLARLERQRLAKLWQEKAIAKHRLLEAESAEVVSQAQLDSAERRYQQSTGGKQTGSGIPVLAPIGGMLAQVNVAPGQYVHEGDALFHIVNVDRLWLEARVAEADIGALQQPSGAWFTLKGFEDSFSTFDLQGRLVALGGAIDPVSRTAPLIFEFDNPGQRLRTGMYANVRVYTGKTARGVMVPTSAVFNDGGQEVVYVMLGGESFQRRMVRLGIRDGDRVQVTSGVEAGERVVSRGAYLVRLASASSAEAGHGHAH